MDIVAVPVGWGRRAGGSFFEASPFSLSGSGLGQTEQQWYARAKAAVVQYDGLLDRARKVAAPAARQELIDRYMGDSKDPQSAIYRRNSVAYSASEAESHTPIDYTVFSIGQVADRVAKLEEWNREFGPAVAEAEKTHGILPESTVVERTVPTGAAAPAHAPANLTLPIVLVGGVVLAGLAVLFLRS